MNERTHHVMVVGGGYAGVIAAARVAREPRARVTLVDPRPAMVQRIRHHQLLAGQTAKRRKRHKGDIHRRFLRLDAARGFP